MTWKILLISSGLFASACVQADVDADLTVSLRHHSNIPNAADANNRFGDRLANLDYEINKVMVSSPGNFFILGLLGQTDVYQNTRGLNRLAAGASLGYSHRFGLGPQSPRIRLNTRLMYEHYDGSLRSGLSHQTSLSVSRWMSDSLLLSGAWQWVDRNAREQQKLLANPMIDVDVFDQQRQELSLRADYILLSGQAISLTAGYADGDIDASARPGTPLRQIAEAIANDNGIRRGYLAYRVKSHTRSAGVQWNLPLSDSSSFSVGAERRLASAQSGIRYQETRFHLDYLVSL